MIREFFPQTSDAPRAGEAAGVSPTGDLARPSNFLGLKQSYGCGEGFPVIGTKITGIVVRFVTPSRPLSTIVIS